MNSSGDPGRDDYGLPPVDIEVPDDARELDRDVQAYRRELRSQRRRNLARRVYGPLTRDGMVLPLLAGCLALTLLAATLLTVFTVGQGVIGPLGHPAAARSPRPGFPAAAAARLRRRYASRRGCARTPMSWPTAHPSRCTRCTGPGGAGARPDPAGLQVPERPAAAHRARPSRAAALGLPCRHAERRREQLPPEVDLGRHASGSRTPGRFPRSYHGRRLAAVLVRDDGSVVDIVRDRGHGFQIAQTPAPAQLAPVPASARRPPRSPRRRLGRAAPWPPRLPPGSRAARRLRLARSPGLAVTAAITGRYAVPRPSLCPGGAGGERQ